MQQQPPLSPCLLLGMTYPPTNLLFPKSLDLEEGEVGETASETPVELIRQIESHIENGEHKKAKDLLCQAFSKNIFDETSYYLYAKTLSLQGLHKMAIRYLKEIANPNEMARELLGSCRKRKREAKEEQTKLAAKRAEIAREEPEVMTSSPAPSLSSSESDRQASLPNEEEESALPETPSLEDRVSPLSSSKLPDSVKNTLKSIISVPAAQEKEASSEEAVLHENPPLEDRVSPLSPHKKINAIGSSSHSPIKNKEASPKQRHTSREKQSPSESRRDASSSKREREEDKRSHSSQSSSRNRDHERTSRDRDHERTSRSSLREKESRSSRKRSSDSLRDSSTSRSEQSRDSHYSRSRSNDSFDDDSYHRRDRSSDRSSSPSLRSSYSSRYESSSSYHSKEDPCEEKSLQEKGFSKPKPYSEDEMSRKKRRLDSYTSTDQHPKSRGDEAGSVSVIHSPREKQLDQSSVSSSGNSQAIAAQVPKTPPDIFRSLMPSAQYLTESLRDNGMSREALTTFRMSIPKLISKDVIQNVSYRIVPLKWQKNKVYPLGWQDDKSNFCEALIAAFNLDEFFIQPRKTPMLNVPDTDNPTLPKNSEETRSFIRRNVREANDKLDLLHHKEMGAYSQPAPYIVARLSPDQLLNQIRFKNQSIDVSNLREVGTHNTSGGVFYYVYRWLWKGLQQNNHILPGYNDLLSDGPILDALKSKGIVIKIFRTEDVAKAHSKSEHYEPITIADSTMQSTRTIRLLQTKLNDGSYHFDLLYPES